MTKKHTSVSLQSEVPQYEWNKIMHSFVQTLVWMNCFKSSAPFNPKSMCFLSSVRQHGADPDPAEWLQAARDERLLPARGHRWQRLPCPEQHEYADRPRVQLRPQREPALLQRGGPAPVRRPQHRGSGGHPALHHPPSQWVGQQGLTGPPLHSPLRAPLFTVRSEMGGGIGGLGVMPSHTEMTLLLTFHIKNVSGWLLSFDEWNRIELYPLIYNETLTDTGVFFFFFMNWVSALTFTSPWKVKLEIRMWRTL